MKDWVIIIARLAAIIYSFPILNSQVNVAGLAFLKPLASEVLNIIEMFRMV